MKASDLYPSKWFKAGDLDEDTGATLTIKQVRIETIGEDEKPVIHFKGEDKGLVCNKTNWSKIVSLLGDETDDWIDRKITLYPDTVNFQGVMTPCIRVRKAPAKQKAPAGPGSTVPTADGGKTRRMTQAEVDAPDDDDPPF